MEQQPKLCLFKLFQNCHVYERGRINNVEFGSLEWVQAICSMCIKSVYARRFKSTRRLQMSKYSVVNTL
jgi:elongation factor P--beta-lysine ligase